MTPADLSRCYRLARYFFCSIKEFLRLPDHFHNHFTLNIRIESIIPNLPLIECIYQPAVIFWVERCCLCKMLIVGCQHGPMFAELESFFIEQSFSDVEHCVVGAPGGDFRFPIFKENISRLDCVHRSRKKLFRRFFHAAIPSARTLRRIGISALRHCSSVMMVRLMVMPYSNDRSLANWLVRTSSSQ